MTARHTIRNPHRLGGGVNEANRPSRRQPTLHLQYYPILFKKIRIKSSELHRITEKIADKISRHTATQIYINTTI